MRESNLQKQIQLDCGRRGWIAEHYESKKLLLPNGSYADSGVPKGYPDLTIYLGNGLICFVECKVNYNKPSEEQNAFINRMTRLGYMCGVIYTLKAWIEFKRFIYDTYQL